jgi:hypothetical protein
LLIDLSFLRLVAKGLQLCESHLLVVAGPVQNHPDRPDAGSAQDPASVWCKAPPSGNKTVAVSVFDVSFTQFLEKKAGQA